MAEVGRGEVGLGGGGGGGASLLSAQPRSGTKREVELGSHCELDRPLLQVSTAACLDAVFVTVFRAAVERENCGVCYLLRTGEHLMFW